MRSLSRRMTLFALLSAALHASPVKDFSLLQVSDGKPWASLLQRGTPTLLLFNGKETGDLAESWMRSVRARHPEPNRLRAASISDLGSLPSFLRGFARSALTKAQEKGVVNMKKTYESLGMKVDRNFNEIVVILPDWDGSVTKSFSAGDVNARLFGVLLNKEGGIEWNGPLDSVENKENLSRAIDQNVRRGD